MTHKNSDFSITRLFSLSVVAGLAATCVMGCAAETTPNETDPVSSAAEALVPAHQAVIHYTDSRAATWLQVGITTVDQSNGAFDGGNANTGGQMTSGTSGQDTMTWNQNGLAQNTYQTNASDIVITDNSTAPHRFTTMRISVLATINGACHQDYEDVDISQGVELDFNGWGATWNGSCWMGDLLKHH
jgi:hypothetical protein